MVPFSIIKVRPSGSLLEYQKHFADIWTYAGPLIGVLLGVLGTYLLERRKERISRRSILQIVECVELVNTRVLDNKVLGPMGRVAQIKVPKGGPESELIDVKELYFARYRFRNLSEMPIEKLTVALDGEPYSIWSSVSEGESYGHPDWWQEFQKSMEEVPEDQSNYPFPYLNPYQSTQHEVFLDLSSYLPLENVKVVGGGQGVKFIFKKASKTIDMSARRPSMHHKPA